MSAGNAIATPYGSRAVRSIVELGEYGMALPGYELDTPLITVVMVYVHAGGVRSLLPVHVIDTEKLPAAFNVTVIGAPV
jgi:hypothetical protein